MFLKENLVREESDIMENNFKRDKVFSREERNLLSILKHKRIALDKEARIHNRKKRNKKPEVVEQDKPKTKRTMTVSEELAKNLIENKNNIKLTKINPHIDNNVGMPDFAFRDKKYIEVKYGSNFSVSYDQLYKWHELVERGNDVYLFCVPLDYNLKEKSKLDKYWIYKVDIHLTEISVDELTK